MHCAMLETVMQMAMQCRDWCGALCNEMRAPEASHQGGHYSPGETHATAVHCTKTKVNITPETPGETTVPKLYQKCANICTMPWFYQDNLQKCKLVTPQYSLFPGITWCWH